MKNKILILLILTLSSTPFLAQQIIPVESLYDHRINGTLPDGPKSLKDINNVLLRFTGIWKGEYNTKKYEIRIERITVPFFEGEEDVLIMRYKITTSNDILIEETLSVQNNDDLNISGNYLQNRTYIFTYQGLDYECGQRASIYIGTGFDGNPNKMKLFLVPSNFY
jgi:hypothetical protein